MKELQGAPSIYSARYAPGTDQDRYRALLKALDQVEERSAYITCALCLSGLSQEIQSQYSDLSAFPGLRWYKNSIVVEGHCHGQITVQAHGSNGFGYDPIFQLSDGRYVGELTAEEKHKVSHRAEACKKIYPFLKKIFDICLDWSYKQVI